MRHDGRVPTTEGSGTGHAWRLVRRTVFLLLGGAVAGAFLILATAIYAPLQPDAEIYLWLFLTLTLVPMALVGLLPGIREIQVAGAHTLLGAEEAMVPEPMRAPHRLRTALWTFVHQVIGVAAGLLLLLIALTVATLLVVALGITTLDVPGMTIDRPTTVLGWTGLILLGAAIITVSGGLIFAGGVGAAWSAPLLLGPIGEDRLVLAEQRLAQERGYRRVSRDLHDGVGHSLSAISLQAAAARRSVEHGRPTDRLGETLRTIEELADRAVDELDHALAILREDQNGQADDAVADRRPVTTVSGSDLTRLDELVTEHQGRGMDLTTRVGVDPADLPGVPSRMAYRICAEGLSNAAKHAAPGPVELLISHTGADLEVILRNPFRPPRDSSRPARTGRGLSGLREAVELVGGTLEAGPVASTWTVRASLPRGVRRG